MTKAEHKESIIRNIVELFDTTNTDTLRLVDGYVQGLSAASKIYKNDEPAPKKRRQNKTTMAEA